jgi:hypothetical protein
MTHKILNRSKYNFSSESSGTLTKIFPQETCDVTYKGYECHICKIVFKGKWEILDIYVLKSNFGEYFK